MTKDKFLSKVREGLRDLPKEERDDAMRYYEEYFEEAGEENVDKVIKELGTPKEVVKTIKGKDYKEKEKIKFEPWVIFLIILSSPFIFTIVMLIFSMILVVWSLAFSLAAVSFSLLLTGFLLTILSFFAIPTGLSSFIFLLGTGLSCLGLGTLMIQFTYVCCKAIVSLCKTLIEKGLKLGGLR